MSQRLLTLLILVAGLSVMATAAGGPGLQTAQSTQPPEATSLLGRKLFSPAPTPESKARMEAQLATAMAAWEKNRDDVEAAIWVGRRIAYLGRYRDAIAFYTEAIK